MVHVDTCLMKQFIEGEEFGGKPPWGSCEKADDDLNGWLHPAGSFSGEPLRRTKEPAHLRLGVASGSPAAEKAGLCSGEGARSLSVEGQMEAGLCVPEQCVCVCVCVRVRARACLALRLAGSREEVDRELAYVWEQFLPPPQKNKII